MSHKIDGTQHELKSWPEFFEPVFDQIKWFEVRKNDRNFQVGDTLRLREWIPEKEAEGYTGRIAIRTVTYILEGGQFGIENGFVVMSLE